jgi:hypothetical protein
VEAHLFLPHFSKVFLPCPCNHSGRNYYANAELHSLILESASSNLHSKHVSHSNHILITMAFKRVRRRLSILPTSSNNQNAKASAQTRSASGSTINSTSSNDSLQTDENLTGRVRKHRQSIPFDRLLTTDELREGLALAPQQNSSSVLAAYSEAAPGVLQGRKVKAVSLYTGSKVPSALRDKSQSYPAAGEALVKPLPSSSSSRRTSIFIGKRGRPSIQEPQKTQINDETRLRAEHNYYESVTPAGQNRRRSMLRSVSKDDYLLARGANPRTGLVTPGVHSASSSYEEVELLKQRGIVPPPKWRQRGDQWVSLDLGEPTPLPSPPQGRSTHHGKRPLRTPPRLTAGKYNQNASPRVVYQKPSVSAALPEDASTPDEIPGRFPMSPPVDLNCVRGSPEGVQKPIIKRKPVAGTPGNSEGFAPPKPVISNDSTDTVVKHSFVTELRSSSAPVSLSFNYETPDAIGKDCSKALPSVPNPDYPAGRTATHVEFQEPFLDHRTPREAEKVRGLRPLAPVRPEKELPCLPMSNGQSQSQALNPPTTIMAHDTATASRESRSILGPRGGNPAYPFVRNKKMLAPRLDYQLDPNTSIEAGIRTPVLSIPTYDNPPSQKVMTSKPMRGAIGGPRPMYQPRTVSENIKKASDAFTGPSATMSTNIRIPTHISTLQPRLQGRSHRMVLGFEANQEQRSYQQHQDRIYPNDPREWKRSMSGNLPPLMPASRPRAHSRPQMPDRADARMRSVPRVTKQRSNQVGSMESHRPWKMIGTNAEGSSVSSAIGTISTAKSEIDQKLIPKPLRPAPVTEKVLGSASSRNAVDLPDFLTDANVSGSEQADHFSQSRCITRNCSHCESGFVAGNIRNITGHSHSPVLEASVEEVKQSTNIELLHPQQTNEATNTQTILATSSGSIEEQVDDRDHTACCTECCTVEDCHKGCLGHPSPSIRSFGGSTVVGSTSVPSSPERSSASVSVPMSVTSSPLKGKLSFVQGLRMRKTLRTRQCPDDGKTIKEKCNALDSPPIELDSHPLSPGSFWGDGQGAVAAAKKAAGSRVRAATTPATPTAMVPSSISGNNTKATKRNISPPRLAVPKIREPRSNNASESSNVGVTPRASKSRNVSAASNVSGITSTSRSRNVSGASILSIEIPPIFSSLGTINFAGVLEMLRVPFEAAAMWIHTHPEFKQWLWKGVEKAAAMSRTVVETGGTLWEVSYVYSKTGKLRCKAPGGIGRLVVDCGRSVGYLLVFVALAISVGRVLGFALGLAQGLLWIVRMVGWLLKRLGLGLLW